MRVARAILLYLIAYVLTLSCSDGHLVQLRTEWASHPLNIDTLQPRFSWAYDGKVTQKSFVLTVFDGEDNVIWMSPKVDGGQMYYVPQEPLPLKPMSSYLWKLTAEDEKGNVVESTASFETGVMGNWMGSWISDGRDKNCRQAPILHKSFICYEDISRARLYYSAAAYADIYINGTRVGSTALNPAYTDYGKRNLYTAVDVTDLLEGRNLIAVTLGCGFYNVIDHTAVWDFDLAGWRGRPRFIAQLYVECADGREYIIGTDSSWNTPADLEQIPFLGDNIYSGDKFDASRNINDSQWRPACVVDAPSPLLQAQYMPLNEVEKTLEGKVRAFSDTLFICDFGENISGLTSFAIKGAKGTRVRVQHAERLDSTGLLSLYHIDEHFRPMEDHTFQTDIYYLDDGENELQGRFCYHGFRYAQIMADHPITVEKANADFIHTAFDEIGTFSCSDREMNAIRDIVLRSYKSNFMSIPTDCPQREKNGWTADAHFSCEIGLMNFDVISSYLKWIDDLADAQREDGQVTAIVPSHGWGLGIGPAWDAVLFILPETVYNYSGDIRAIEKIVPTCERYLAWLEGREQDGGIIPYGLSDWCYWEIDTPNDYISTCYYYLMNKTMARFLTLLGRDASQYSDKAESLKALICERYYHQEEETFANGTQCAQALALYMGLVPEGHEEAVARKLSETVAACDNHLNYGVIGSKTVPRMLTKYGYVDQAYAIVIAPGQPSYADWVRKGYTTSLEMWVAKDGLRMSDNHVFLGDIVAWMMSDLTGIQPDPEVPGFGHFFIRPHFPQGLDNANATYNSVVGMIKSFWRRQGGSVQMNITVPGNTSATVEVGDRTYTLKPGDHKITIKQ